jgi:NTP pyrophosphatase (non-canonical NTP hydrolase)
MKDRELPIQRLKDAVREFTHERRWESYHSPKNLSMSIAIEAAELMEHFQWLATEESVEIAKEVNNLAQIKDEIADIAIYLLSLSNALDLDLSAAILAKMEKNKKRYPA